MFVGGLQVARGRRCLCVHTMIVFVCSSMLSRNNAELISKFIYVHLIALQRAHPLDRLSFCYITMRGHAQPDVVQLEPEIRVYSSTAQYT